MVKRFGIAGIVAVAGVLAIVVQAPAFARSGGLAVSRGAPMMGAVRRIGGPIFPPGRHLARPPVPVAAVAPVNGLHRTFIRRPHRFFGSRLPANGIGLFYGSGYGGFDNAPAYYGPDLVQPIVDDRVAALPRGCGVDTRIVPSEHGGERRITVSYCVP